MFVNKHIKFEKENTQGLFQDIYHSPRYEYINFGYSSIDFASGTPESIFLDDTSYFCSLESSNYNNFLTIEIKDRFLYITGYVLRSTTTIYQGQDIFYLRQWSVLGSIDNESWIPLHSKDENDELKGNDYHWYQMKGGPFRYIKIQQQGPSAGFAPNHYQRMRVSYFDIFGYMSNGHICTHLSKSRFFNRLLIICIFI